VWFVVSMVGENGREKREYMKIGKVVNVGRCGLNIGKNMMKFQYDEIP